MKNKKIINVTTTFFWVFVIPAVIVLVCVAFGANYRKSYNIVNLALIVVPVILLIFLLITRKRN